MDVNLISKQLEEIKHAFACLQKSGINPDMLEMYLKGKTHLNMKHIRIILHYTKKFFAELITENRQQPAGLREVYAELVTDPIIPKAMEDSLGEANSG